MKINPSKIKTPYQLLVVFLGVVEVLLGYWISQASSSNERIVAGILMTVIFIIFLVKVVQLRKLDVSVISPTGLDDLTPAKTEVETGQIESHKEEQIAGPHGRYVINKPPTDWDVKRINIDEWNLELYGITDPEMKRKHSGTSAYSDDILVFSAKNQINVLPYSGKTIVNGRKINSALETIVKTQLSICDVERFQPPSYVEGNLEHSLLTFVSAITQPGVVILQKISEGMISNKRQYYMYEFSQDIKNAKINGVEEQDCKIHIVILGIEGEVRDHFLILRYGIVASSDKNSTGDIDILSKLINSFQPLKIINPDKERTKIKNQSNKLYEQQVKDTSEKVFGAELAIFFARLIDKDLENRVVQTDIIEQLKLFEIFSNTISLKTPELNAFWKSLHEAEKGNFTNLSVDLKDAINAQKPSNPAEPTD